MYINENLSAMYKSLAYNCRQLKRAKRIQDCWFSNGHLKVRRLDGKIKEISHELDMYHIAVDFDFSFDTSLYEMLGDDEEDMNMLLDLDGADVSDN